MKAISLWQPWASAIALGAKRVETRSWGTRYRGPLAIHAAKHLNKSELIFMGSCWNWHAALRPLIGPMGSGKYLEDVLPFGAIVATCELIDCRPSESFTVGELDTPRFPDGMKESHEPWAEEDRLNSWTERQMGDFSPPRFGWVLENIVGLAVPIPFRGAQGLFDVPDSRLANTTEHRQGARQGGSNE